MNTKQIKYDTIQEEKINFSEGSFFQLKIHSIKRTSIHWHVNALQIVLPLRGSVKVTSGFEYQTVKEGDFLFVNHKYIHTESPLSISVNPFSSNNFHINGEYIFFNWHNMDLWVNLIKEKVKGGKIRYILEL